MWSLGFVNLSRTTWVEKYVAKLSTSRKTGGREKEGARQEQDASKALPPVTSPPGRLSCSKVLTASPK